jgi:hypothetical protein
MSAVRSVQRKAAKRKVENMSGTKVKLSNGEIVPAFNALSLLGNEKFGIAFSFRIKRALAALRSPIELYQESRKEIVEEHAKRDAEGNPIVSSDGQEYQMANANWQPKIKELDAADAVELDGLSAKDLVAACEAADVNVNANTLVQLGAFLIDDLDAT